MGHTPIQPMFKDFGKAHPCLPRQKCQGKPTYTIRAWARFGFSLGPSKYFVEEEHRNAQERFPGQVGPQSGQPFVLCLQVILFVPKKLGKGSTEFFLPNRAVEGILLIDFQRKDNSVLPLDIKSGRAHCVLSKVGLSALAQETLFLLLMFLRASLRS